MKKLLPIFFVLTIATDNSTLEGAQSDKIISRKFHVSGSIMQTVSYCGGAKPSQQVLDSLRKPRGIAFGKLFVREGKVNKLAKIIDTIIAGADGNFSLYLPAGNYCLVEEWKTKRIYVPINSKVQKIDSACLKKLYEACDFQLTITNKDIDKVKIIFHRNCFFSQPCISYSGPLPH